MKPDHKEVQELVHRIVELIHPLRIILFGSAARGEARTDSDVDLLIVVPEGTHRRRTAQNLYCKLSGVGVPFDLLVATPSDLVRYRDNSGLIYRTILKEGVKLYAA